jgi:hypothetical protein
MIKYIMNALYNTFVPANEVIPGIWLGNLYAGSDENFLLENNIDLVINCTPTIPFISPSTNDPVNVAKLNSIEKIRIPVQDSLLEKDFVLMETYLGFIIPYMFRKYAIEKKKILVHCRKGKQRSCIVIAAFLKYMLDNNKLVIRNVPRQHINQRQQLMDIINFIVEKRPQAFTYGFRINFEKTFLRFFSISEDSK